MSAAQRAMPITVAFVHVVPRLKQHDTSNGLSSILGTSLGLRQGVLRGRVARIVSSPQVVVHDKFDVVPAFPTIEPSTLLLLRRVQSLRGPPGLHCELGKMDDANGLCL
eukprot:CAMPEP_0183398532 /NCGR_PEP_ID=MMETSP0370-20130417/11323_1 /TAXON_ID=268820 /ORGANISM="Peridinium aciculiferum, Strain PAER-2" /LENGTH=108 /DNA_ID=CAMNT_0025579563 /DNA_START=29 /DNA_END=355 /DNA_ORIENTATION=+